MAKSKFYGVKVGEVPGVYKTWSECQKQVSGYPGALFKSFPSEEEAREYVTGAAGQAGGENAGLPPARYNIFVDGSYANQRYGWAFVVYDGAEQIHVGAGVGTDNEAAVIHNVAGELEATVQAIRWAEKEGIKPVTIHHDYIGISEWAVGKWKTNNRFTQAYASFVRPYLDWVSFHKVTGHSGVEGNELADKLAGEALRKAK